jgi:prepilin-type N-terminal cleavage/methylation domain-containing protein
MKEPNASRLSLFNRITLHSLPMRYARSGFTLVELMVAAAASLILTSIAFASLLTFQQMSQKQDEKAAQKAELQRALRFIASDIQEGKSVERTAPELSAYQELFQIKRPDGTIIGYYSKTRLTGPREDWSGPRIIFRKVFPKNAPPKDARALIDQIASQSSSDCPGSPGSAFSNVGVSLAIEGSKATVCLVGHLSTSDEVLVESIQATARAR